VPSGNPRGTLARFGPFEFDPSSGELRKYGVKIKVHGQPVEILALLLAQPATTVTREELQRRLWPDNTFVDFESGLNAAVKRLRAALSDSPEKRSRGTTPIRAANSRPLWKAPPLPIAAMSAVAVTGPMPGIATSRRQASFS